MAVCRRFSSFFQIIHACTCWFTKKMQQIRGMDGWFCMVPVLDDEIFEVDNAGLLHLRCNFTAVDDLEQAWQIPLIEWEMCNSGRGNAVAAMTPGHNTHSPEASVQRPNYTHKQPQHNTGAASTLFSTVSAAWRSVWFGLNVAVSAACNACASICSSTHLQ